MFNEDIKLYLAYETLNGGVICQARFSSYLLWSIGALAALLVLEAKVSEWVKHLVHTQV